MWTRVGRFIIHDDLDESGQVQKCSAKKRDTEGYLAGGNLRSKEYPGSDWQIAGILVNVARVALVYEYVGVRCRICMYSCSLSEEISAWTCMVKRMHVIGMSVTFCNSLVPRQDMRGESVAVRPITSMLCTEKENFLRWPLVERRQFCFLIFPQWLD